MAQENGKIMNLRLHPDWKAILKHAWSVRLIVITAILTGAEAALPFVTEFVSANPVVWALITFSVTVAALISRIVAQKDVSS